MTDEEFREMLRLLHKFGTESMDQFDHFRIGDEPIWVAVGLMPQYKGTYGVYRPFTAAGIALPEEHPHDRR